MKRIQKLITGITCLILLFTAACKKDNDTTPSATTTTTTGGTCTNTFAFLHTGDSLQYSMTVFGTNYVVYQSFAATSTANVYKTVISTVGMSNTAVRYLKWCDGWLRDDTDAVVNDTLHYIKETRALGDSWNYYYPGYSTYNQYTVAQKNVNVTTPAGTFTCDRMLFYQSGTINTDTV